MRFSAVFVALATAGFAVAQEALRFGTVDVVGNTQITPGEACIFPFSSTLIVANTILFIQNFDIHYDASKARNHPLFVDFFVQGKFANGNPTPRLLLSRNEFGADAVTLDKTATLPPVDTLGETNSWLLWADVTFPQDGFVMVGGTSAPFTVA
ncbi:hypothetical protein VNI00_016003 [Paramarasmius palmivorus]|uniref:Uncharacterized protein n=1 Tax=Paramarasmius palmivorus TaxID=297713 RepID=A0AAW0BGW3_9AGAR